MFTILSQALFIGPHRVVSNKCLLSEYILVLFSFFYSKWVPCFKVCGRWTQMRGGQRCLAGGDWPFSPKLRKRRFRTEKKRLLEAGLGEVRTTDSSALLIMGVISWSPVVPLGWKGPPSSPSTATGEKRRSRSPVRLERLGPSLTIIGSSREGG